MSPRQRRGEATVDRLLTAALEVYATSGRPGFTVVAVTAAGGVSLGSLYHHFGSIEDLAAALYTRCTEQLFDEMIAALSRARTARDGVRALVTAYLRFTEEPPDAALFLHACARSTAPLRWLLGQRVRLAQELLESSDESVERIAARTGMGTAATLRRHFTRVTGLPPEAYRRTFGAS